MGFFNKIVSLFSVIFLLFNFDSYIITNFQNDNSNTNDEIKNIICLIPDGCGFGILDLAESVKLNGVQIPNSRTDFTSDAIDGEHHDNLYLTDYQIATSNTNSLDGITDSSAGGTALSSGYKTNNMHVGVTSAHIPQATILEACQLSGKSTGIITTSCYYDATPASFSSHASDRQNYYEISSQMMQHNLDIVLGAGSYNVQNYNSDFIPQIASDFNYDIVSNREDLYNEVNNGTTKIWSNFNPYDRGNKPVMDPDVLQSSTQPTLKDMTVNALNLLNINCHNENGFFLLIEGGQIDYGCHCNNPLLAVSELLSFDETFAYCVNWAKKDGHTIVISCADHDCGALDVFDVSLAISNIINFSVSTEGIVFNTRDRHSGQNVPISLYAPESIKKEYLSVNNLLDGVPIRSGKYFSGTIINNAMTIENINVFTSLFNLLGIDLDKSTKLLFFDISNYGILENNKYYFLVAPKYGIYYNSNRFLNNSSDIKLLKYGCSVFIDNCKLYVPLYYAKEFICKTL